MYRRRYRLKRYKRRAFKRPRRRLATKKFVKKQFKRLMETKHLDLNFASTLNTPNFYRMTNISQDTTDTSRIGDKLRLKSIKIKATFTLPVANTDIASGRLIIFQWHPNDADYPPNFGDILESISSPAQYMNSNLRWDKSSQFTVLKDFRITMSRNEKPVMMKTLKINLKYAKKTLKYVAANTYGQDMIYWLTMGDQSVSGNAITYVGQFRLTWTDG